MFQNHPKYRVIHYGHDESKTDAYENVAVTNNDVLAKAYGGYNWKKEFFKHNTGDHANVTFNKNAGKEILARKKKNDLILCFWGYGHEPAAKEANKDKDLIIVEPGIGYTKGAFAQFRCYESYPLKATCIGLSNVRALPPQWYWRVVPNYFDLREFNATTSNKEDWALYIGRINKDKGVDIAIDACAKAGIKLKICGQGGYEQLGLKSWPSHVEYLGYADVYKRKELMSKARFGFLLSTYWEPFGGTGVEMMLSGCVPITTDSGAMTEYIVDGVNGFRCFTMGDILRAIRSVDVIDRSKMIKYAQNNFSLESIKLKFERAFGDFEDIYTGRGWYEDHNRPLVGLGLDFKDLYV